MLIMLNIYVIFYNIVVLSLITYIQPCWAQGTWKTCKKSYQPQTFEQICTFFYSYLACFPRLIFIRSGLDGVWTLIILVAQVG